MCSSQVTVLEKRVKGLYAELESVSVAKSMQREILKNLWKDFIEAEKFVKVQVL